MKAKSAAVSAARTARRVQEFCARVKDIERYRKRLRQQTGLSDPMTIQNQFTSFPCRAPPALKKAAHVLPSLHQFDMIWSFPQKLPRICGKNIFFALVADLPLETTTHGGPTNQKR